MKVPNLDSKMKDLDDKLKKVSASQVRLFEAWGVKKNAYTINEFLNIFEEFYELFMNELSELEKKREQARKAEKQLKQQKELTQFSKKE